MTEDPGLHEDRLSLQRGFIAVLALALTGVFLWMIQDFLSALFLAAVDAADWGVMGRTTHEAAFKPQRRRVVPPLGVGRERSRSRSRGGAGRPGRRAGPTRACSPTSSRSSACERSLALSSDWGSRRSRCGHGLTIR